MDAFPFTRPVAAVAFALTAGALQAQATPARVRVTLPAYRTPIAIDTIIQARTRFDLPAGQVFAAAERAFYDLKIATDLRDSVGGVIGVKNLRKSSYLAGQPMSKLMNCGLDMTGPKADIYRINLALVALITPLSPTQAELGVGFAASGLDMRGSSTDPVMCGTTGQMELAFADRVSKLLKAP